MAYEGETLLPALMVSDTLPDNAGQRAVGAASLLADIHGAGQSLCAMNYRAMAVHGGPGTAPYARSVQRLSQ